MTKSKLRLKGKSKQCKRKSKFGRGKGGGNTRLQGGRDARFWTAGSELRTEKTLVDKWA
jgi:hypothetical protein